MTPVRAQSGDMAALAVRATGSLPVAAASLKAVPFRRSVPPRGPCARAAEAATMEQQAPDNSSRRPLSQRIV